MIPILYEQTEKTFKSNGLGRLADATSCIVHERRNENFDLDLTYPVCGKYARELRVGRIIYATHDRTGKPQPFDITSVSAESHGQVRVTAQHISRRLKGVLTKLNHVWWNTNVVKSFFDYLNGAGTTPYIIGDCDFTFHTDVTDENRSYSPQFSKFYSVYEHLMDKQYGLLSVENGVCPDAEYKFDMFDVWLLKARGAYRGTKIRTGTNVKSLTEEETDKHLITGVLAFWNGNDPVTGKNRTISITGDMASVLDSSDFGKPEDILSSGVSLPYQKVETLDLSAKFSTPPTPAQVRVEAQFYLDQKKEFYAKGSSSYAVDLMCDTENTSSLQSVNLCDWVMLEDTNLRVQKKLQVTEVWFDTLRDRYTNMTVGLLPRTFKQLVHKESSHVNKKTDNVSTQVRDLASKTTVKQKSYPVGYDPNHPEKWKPNGTIVDEQGKEMEEIATVNRHPVFVYKQQESGGGTKIPILFFEQYIATHDKYADDLQWTIPYNITSSTAQFRYAKQQPLKLLLYSGTFPVNALKVGSRFITSMQGELVINDEIHEHISLACTFQMRCDVKKIVGDVVSLEMMILQCSGTNSNASYVCTTGFVSKNLSEDRVRVIRNATCKILQ